MAERDPIVEALRGAVDRFAAERAPDLVAEAQAEATAKVRSMLAEAIAESLLEHSATALRPASPPRSRRAAEEPQPARPEPSQPSKDAPLGYYVYGVVSAGSAQSPDVAGVDAAYPVTLIENRGLAAIASQVSLEEFGEDQLHENLNDVRWLEEKARAHEEVLDAALARMTVVPLRLCTIYSGPEQVREMLQRERAVFGDALGRLEGKTEWGVKVIAAPGALERAASPRAEGGGTREEPAERSRGTAYIEEKRRQARARGEADQVATEWAEVAHEKLAAVASEALLNPLQRPEVGGYSGEMLLNGVYLVDHDATDDFRAVVEAIKAEYGETGVSVELTGPWPPYNFVKSSIEAAR